MIVRSEKDVRNLAGGSVKLRKGSAIVTGYISDDYATQAARVIVDNNDLTTVSNQADVVRLAINRYHWGLGAKGYMVE